MEIKKVKSQLYIAHAMCECGGEFVQPKINYDEPQIDLLIKTTPTKYKHVCNKCGKIMYFEENILLCNMKNARINL